MSESASSQRKAISEWLREHNSLTTIQARNELGVMHPAARILELRQESQNIKTHWTTTVDRAGKKHREAKYVLFSDTQKKEVLTTSDQTNEKDFYNAL